MMMAPVLALDQHMNFVPEPALGWKMMLAPVLALDQNRNFVPEPALG